MQHADLAVQQLDYGVKKLGLRGMSVGTHVNGEDLANPKFNPIWAKCEELGVLVFMHPVAYPPFAPRLRGNGGLINVIGNPLDTTIALSHLIFEGTLDRYPKLKLCASHGGGYLPSYADRSDAGCISFPDRCRSVPLKKKPTEYLRQLYYDTIIFTPEALTYLASRVGVGQIMLGTDYPFPWAKGGATVDHVLNTPGFSDAEKVGMLGGTAAQLLGIKA
jgi:aminocarboxymuconate-semialdehyde decarboxylase